MINYNRVDENSIDESRLLPGKKLNNSSRVKEKLIKAFFTISAFTTLTFFIFIFLFLLKEGMKAFWDIGITDFLYSVNGNLNALSRKVFEWYPTSENARYSLLPLLLGSLMTAIPATIISSFFGIGAGIYLAEIANSKTREFLKPVIELFAAIPTVVLGFIMLAVGATFFNDIFMPANRLNAFVSAFALSLVVIPVIASLTEDAIRSIPLDLRMASYGLGATKYQTVMKVILPAAFSGISASVLLGFGRAIGETMIVLMVSGNAANFSGDFFSSVRTLTATIAAEMGEVSRGSGHYYALFLIGIVLFVITFVLNLSAELIINKMRKKIRQL